MKSILMTTSAVLLVTGLAAGQAQAACPEDIDAFDREYQQTLQNAAAGEALSSSEQAQLFGLRTAAENLHQAGNAEMCAEVIQRADVILGSAIAPQVIRPDELVGREVTNAQEENLGEIEDVMLDPVSGRIAYVVIEHGGFLGIGDDLFAVPWGAMQFVPGNDQKLLLDIPEDKLENAPRFSREDESPLERREWVTSVHNYYGVQPYWQDEVGTMALQYGGGTGAMPAAFGGAAGAATEGQAGTQPGAGTGGEVKTIVVPITQPDSQAQPQSGAQSQEAQPEGTGSEAEGTGAQPDGSEPQDKQESGTGTQPDTQSDTQSGTKSEAGGAAEPPAGAASLAAGQAADSEGSAAVEALVARMDQLEQEVQELSQKDIGAEVKQSIASLEEQVRTLSERMPGQEVTQAIERLEKQVAAFGEAPGQAADRSSGASGEAGQAATVVVVPGQSGGSSEGGQNSQAGQDSQSGEPSGQAQGGQSGQSGQSAASTGAGAAAQSETTGQSGQEDRAGSQEGQAGQQQDQASGQQENAGGQEQARGEQTSEALAAQAATTEGATGAATGAAPTAAEQPSAGPCQEQIAALEKDLTRAEELGVATKEAQSELKEAQAMLNNNSEALCRAAIKRAHEGLVAVGFEPTGTD